MKLVRKLASALPIALISIFALQTVIMAASHDQDNPTKLQLNTEYESNAGYGDEYYTFDIDTPSRVNISAEPVPISHSYTVTITGSNDMEPIKYEGTEVTDIDINTYLRAGTYYMKLTSSIGDWSDPIPLTEPDEAWYILKIQTSPLNKSVDNSTLEYFPPIADQGDADSSVGYATTYYQMTYTESKARKADSSKYTFSPEWTYSLINGGNDNGAYASDAYKILNNFGAPLKNEFTGTATSMETNADVWASAMKYRLNTNEEDDYYTENTFNDTTEFLVSMKEQLDAGEVLVTGSNSGWWYGDNEKESVTIKKDGIETEEKGIAYISDNGKDEDRQLLTVVGYDDNITFTYGPYTTKGAFKIANSRGTDWGNDGFIWVAYDAFYQNSEDRPAKKNGYGFTSSWWWHDADQNVYYLMSCSSLDYTPEYTGVFTFSGQDISNLVLTYRGRRSSSYAVSAEKSLYDNTQYIMGMSSQPFTGSIALDLSRIPSSYFTGTSSCWEIISEGIVSGDLQIYNQSNSSLFNVSGESYDEINTSWHKHVYDRIENFTYSGSRWYRYDECAVCGGTNTVSGTCYLYMDFESSTGTWGNNGKGILSQITDSGNKYLKIDYSNPNDTTPQYFEIYNPSSGAYSGIQMSGNIEMTFDVKFEGGDADIILKRRQPDIDNTVLRVSSKEGGRLMYGTDGSRTYFNDKNGWMSSLNKWLTIEITANITSDSTQAKQSIKVIDKATGEVLSTVNNAKLQNNDSFCNLLVIGGSCTVDVDNIAIRKIS
ncbi:MAG: C1 family peptidase [bacterium]|nr:C1 family peptidase [bacterium]